jgi:hypothetical protein
MDSIEISSTVLHSKTFERVLAYDQNSYAHFSSKYDLPKALYTLKGILKGIAIDGTVNSLELDELKNWCDIHNKFLNKHPFSDLIPTILRAIDDSCLDPEEIKDIDWLCTRLTSDNIYKDVITEDILQLHGILHGILADNEITLQEVQGLQTWLDDNKHLSSTYPYDEIYSLVALVLEDGILDDNEKKLLKAFFTDFIEIKNSRNIDCSDIATIKKDMSKLGVCTKYPNLSIAEKLFCFTGKSSKLTRNGFATIITSLGGYYKDNVVADTEYLIIGNEGNPCWTFSCYGRKVEAAIKLRRNGKNLLIVHENDFWNFYDNYVAHLNKLG